MILHYRAKKTTKGARKGARMELGSILALTGLFLSCLFYSAKSHSPPSKLGGVSALTGRSFSWYWINSQFHQPIQLQRHRQQSVNFFDDALRSVDLNPIPVPDTHN